MSPQTWEPEFVAPAVGVATQLAFRFSATDDRNGYGSDSMVVTVEPNPGAQRVSAFIDFETLPDGTLATEFEEAADSYGDLCLLFRNLDARDDSKAPEFRRFVSTNTVLWDNDRLFNPPPETNFNITAEFRVPAASVEADVTVAAGKTITMTALGYSGGVLGAVTSSESVACCAASADTLSLDGIGDIYAVLWETSLPKEIVPIIDNLRVDTVDRCDNP